MWEIIVESFKTPSDFSGDVYIRVINQAGHALLVGWGLFIFLNSFLKNKLAMYIIIVSYIIFETLQFYYFGVWNIRTIGDGILDTFFVVAGVLIANASMLGQKQQIQILTFILFIGFIYLIYGV